ncbi:MAG: hypothetical protein HQ521_02730, partial [Bacteroidetes bacterium]|nr:hypothetical protein [Bacteroidota bacterium]
MAIQESISKMLRVKLKLIKLSKFFKQSNEWRCKMIKSIDHYTYRVTWSEDDQEHVGLCVEFPSLSWLESKPEKALLGIRKLVQDCITDLQSEKEEIPEPIATKKFSGKF